MSLHLMSYQTRLARGASLRVSIGDIADLLELSPREIEELRKFHNDPKPKEVRSCVRVGMIHCSAVLPSLRLLIDNSKSGAARYTLCVLFP